MEEYSPEVITAVLDPKVVGDAVKRMDWVLAYMTITDRFNYEVLGRCKRLPSTRIGTMGVGPQGLEVTLEFSPGFTATLDDDELRYVLSHEVLHIVFHHITTQAPKDKGDAKLDNVAADLAINSLLGSTPGHNGKPPVARQDMYKKDGSLHIKKGDPWVLLPRQFGFPERLSMAQYRELLRYKYGEDKGKLEGDTEGQEMDDHGGWQPSEIADAEIAGWVDSIESSKSWGHLKADTVAAIVAAQRNEVGWDKVLRYYLGRMDTTIRRHTMKKPSRRVGYPWSGTTHVQGDKPLFAPDTSASVDDGNLSKFLCELNALAARRVVDFMSWSCGLTMDKPVVWDRRKTSLDFKGRGSTDPQPMLDYAAANGYKQVIMLTDGEFGTPVIPPRLDVLWVITCDGTTGSLPPGSKVVQMKHKG